jgi:MFS family permease
MRRAKLINAAVFLAIVAGMYLGCAVAAAVTGYPPPISGVLVLALGRIIYGAVDGAAVIVAGARARARAVSRRRRARALDDYQIGVNGRRGLDAAQAPKQRAAPSPRGRPGPVHAWSA